MIQIDALGDTCPIPVVKTKKAIESMEGPGVVETLVDNEIAVQNVTKMAQSSGGTVTSEKLAEKEFKVTIQLSGTVAKDTEAAPVTCIPDSRRNTVVVIAADHMGEGKEDLGKVLIKGFIFALTQLEELPKTILFYNGGAKITA